MESKVEMIPTEQKRGAQAKPTAAKLGQMKKVSTESSKLLLSLKERANKKTFGRKVKESEILDVALKLVTHEHLKTLQDATYSAQDRLKMRHEEYQRANGKISFDGFIAKWMNGEIKVSSSNPMTQV